MPLRPLLRPVRLVSGLVLMLFVVGHLANLALGLHSLGAMGAARWLLLDPWRTPVGAAVLALAALVHAALGLVAIAQRRSLAMSRTDAVQLVLGVLTPPLLATHVVAAHVAGQFGENFAFPYGQMLAVYWSFAPQYAFQQLFVVLFIWVHAALGLHAWLVLLPVWRRIGALVLPLLFAVPILALLGFAESGRAVLERLQTDVAWKALIVAHLQPIQAMVATLDAGKDLVLAVYGALLLLALTVTAARQLRDRARPVAVRYDAGEQAQGRRGLSVLEISLAGDVAHAHVCSGRGRCGTCRVRVDAGAQALSPADAHERATLARVHAPPGSRLACQARVLGPGVVVARLLPAHADASAAREPGAWVGAVEPAGEGAA